MYSSLGGCERRKKQEKQEKQEKEEEERDIHTTNKCEKTHAREKQQRTTQEISQPNQPFVETPFVILQKVAQLVLLIDQLGSFTSSLEHRIILSDRLLALCLAEPTAEMRNEKEKGC
jgi:hypothetical protein